MYLDGEAVLTIVVRWIHILAAVAAVGAMIFWRFALAPAAAEALSPEEHDRLREAVLRRWRKFLGVLIGLLLLTGIYNFIKIGLPKADEAPEYHGIFGVKFLLALGIFFLASALVGRSEALAPVRAKSARWLAINILLAVVVILLSGFLARPDRF